MNKKLNSFLLMRLVESVSEAKKITDDAREDIKKLTAENIENFRFNIEIVSAWKEEGEKTIEVNNAKNLKEAIHHAIDSFKKENKRSDVQGTYYVYMSLPSGRDIKLPEKFWKKYRESGEKK